MKTREFTLDEALKIGIAADKHARSKIKIGSTHIENNLLALEDSLILVKVVEGNKGLRRKIDSQETQNRLESDDEIAYFESVIYWTSKKQQGNCLELAMQAFDYI